MYSLTGAFGSPVPEWALSDLEMEELIGVAAVFHLHELFYLATKFSQEQTRLDHEPSRAAAALALVPTGPGGISLEGKESPTSFQSQGQSN